jgi:hypothetical protein
MGQEMKIIARQIDDFDIQSLVDSQLDWEEEKRIWREIERSPLLMERYDELVRQKKLLLTWWAGEGNTGQKKSTARSRRETLPV